MVALGTTALTQLVCGNYTPTGSLADELLVLAGEKSAAYFKAVGTMFQGDLLAPTGKGSAIQTISSALAALRSTGATLFIPGRLSALAHAYADLGRFDDAWRSIGEAMTAADTTKERWWDTEINRVAGEIALKQPDQDAAKAEEYFDRALSVARRQQAKSWELRAAMSLARLWREQGKVHQARELLAPVYGWFTEGFDTRDLKDAKALLEELAA
jgi:predicted ATPase